MPPEKLVLIDIDGLRPDVFKHALARGRVPNLARLVGSGLHIPALAPAPSITFCSQACLFTGAHPYEHGVPGNQFFDRFGTESGGVPRHYAFDVGDILAVDDAVTVFTGGLASGRLQARTIYERISERGLHSVVAGNMYARGATQWLKPSLANIARFTKGGNLFGMPSQDYDLHILKKLLDTLDAGGLPDLTTMYFMGLDHESHSHGPEPAQMDYLVEHIDPMLGQLWDAIEGLGGPPPLVTVFSDHGQIGVVPDDAHSLKIGFPFDKEMAHLFTALGLDVHDYPGEDPDCDAVMALNGGLAFVYLQNRTGRWAAAPVFMRDVLPVARAFWEAHRSGRYAAELHAALAAVLVRDVEREGWNASYQALDPGGDLRSLEDWFAAGADGLSIDAADRLNRLSGPFSGDLVLVSNYAEGYYFGGETRGVHGGLHPEDSRATMAFGWPGGETGDWERAGRAIREAIEDRCRRENGRMPGTCDLVVGLEAAAGSLFQSPEPQ